MQRNKKPSGSNSIAQSSPTTQQIQLKEFEDPEYDDKLFILRSTILLYGTIVGLSLIHI